MIALIIAGWLVLSLLSGAYWTRVMGAARIDDDAC